MEKETTNPQVIAQWLAEIEKAAKREKDFTVDARSAISTYEGGGSDRIPFNILYSNTETLSPALYNATPSPVVKPRYKTDDPVADIASKVAEGLLTYSLDTNGREYPSFDTLMQSAVLSALVPGRGCLWFKYDANTTEHESGESGETTETVDAEDICAEEVPWDRLYFGYAKSWETVPWVARLHFFTPDEIKSNFPGLTTKLNYNETAETGSDEGKSGEADPESKGVKLAKVYEIWDKVALEVLFISPNAKEEILRRAPDPLQLSGFYPCPKPLQFFQRIGSLTPIPLYMTYKEQAKELNAITKRITILVDMMRVRGFYDATLDGIEDLLNQEDGVLLPAENVAALQQGATLERSIWLMPIDKIVLTLQQLYTQRSAVKQTIYEINGIADIMRGASVASETLGAQELKNQWGTLRLKRMQKMVAAYVCSSLRIMLEISVTQLSIETIAKVTGIQLPREGQKAQAQQMAQQFQAQQQPLPPQLIAILSQPSWEEVMSVLQDDVTRSYRVDIETNSTVDAEATEDKKNIGEFLNAMAQFLHGFAPLVAQGTLPFEAMQSIMLSVVKKFRFGVDVEEQLKKMTAPPPPPPPAPPPPPPPAPPPSPAEEAAAQTALMLEQQKQQTIQMQAKQAEMDFQLQSEEHQFKMDEMTRKAQLSMLTYQSKKQQMELKGGLNASL